MMTLITNQDVTPLITSINTDKRDRELRCAHGHAYRGGWASLIRRVIIQR